MNEILSQPAARPSEKLYCNWVIMLVTMATPISSHMKDNYVGVYCNADCKLSVNYAHNKVKGVISLFLYISFVYITVFILFRLGPPSPLHTGYSFEAYL